MWGVEKDRSCVLSTVGLLLVSAGNPLTMGTKGREHDMFARHVDLSFKCEAFPSLNFKTSYRFSDVHEQRGCSEKEAANHVRV